MGSDENDDEQPSYTQGFMRYARTYFKFFGVCFMIWSLGYMRCSPILIALGSFGYFGLQIARNQRAQLTEILKEIGRDEKEFFLKNVPINSLPSWIYFPDVERAEWLNKVIRRVWPFLCEYVKQEILIDVVEPAVSKQCPHSLQPFKFVTIDLGDTPPRIGGVKVYMGEVIQRDEVIVDVDLILYSDARIKVQLGKLCAGVKKFELRGTLRVVLKPLVPKVPFTGAVTLSFLDSPYINFELTDMANVLAFPGLQQTLDSVVRNTVNQLLVLPNRIPVQLLDDVDVLRLKYPMPEGVMRICILQARDLKIADKQIFGRGSSDPYCVVRVGAETFKTQVVWKSLNPEWNDIFETVVSDYSGQSIQLEVFDKDQGNKDDYLGSTSIPIESVFERGILNTWVVLEGVKSGSVHLNLMWLNLSNRVEDIATALEKAMDDRSSSEKPLSSGFLYIVVEEARHLKLGKEMREPSPFCSLSIGRHEQQTVAKERTQDPSWQSVHFFLINEPYVDILHVKVQDERTGVSLGKCSIPVKQLLTQHNMSVSRPFPLEESGSASAYVYLHMEYKALIPKIVSIQYSLTAVNGALNEVGLLDRAALTESTGVVPDKVGDSPTQPKDQPNNLHCPDPQASPPSTDVYTSSLNNVMEKSDIENHNSDEWTFRGTPDSDCESALTVGKLAHVDLPSSSEESNPASMGQIRLSIEYRSNSSTLLVTVHEASDLRGVDKDGLADPYVRVSMLVGSGNVFGQKKKTKPVKDSLNPVYETRFEFTVNTENLSTHSLCVDVRNHVSMFTRSGRVHQMGSIRFALSQLVAGQHVNKWFALKHPKRLSMLSIQSD